MRLLAWSGPRNLSTAMMYAFAARPDFDVMDEPFYAAYLAATGLPHPMRDEILAGQPTDPADVAQLCQARPKAHVYQKHMAHHMSAGMPLGWAEGAVHLHLIRHPARVIASYGAKRDEITEDDIAFAAQATLYDRFGGIVVDTSDLRNNPEKMLRKICAECGLPWTDAMLRWPAGGHAADGVWARHWYGAVHRSTGFAGPEGPLPQVTRDDLLAAALPFYRALKARAI
ncbi:branched chain amino acid aminotransferase [Jannaschia pagri]|uniref:Branched chain amino acid aminotransferase n=1 Tax=Jannaschia pagri TaxID=2829797 RepID=A0ABQ4NQ59_9RHOB|nr:MULTISPECIES: sulfotransferase [unclassified Jannaschia]GIT92594.1 branched chain amino acid aminotransferase [Jannaschia sp. AI_61]GIT96546.1 branched chain amino acid aminotransferase [Jannaschia sp. AI_62]